MTATETPTTVAVAPVLEEAAPVAAPIRELARAQADADGAPRAKRPRAKKPASVAQLAGGEAVTPAPPAGADHYQDAEYPSLLEQTLATVRGWGKPLGDLTGTEARRRRDDLDRAFATLAARKSTATDEALRGALDKAMTAVVRLRDEATEGYPAARKAADAAQRTAKVVSLDARRTAKAEKTAPAPKPKASTAKTTPPAARAAPVDLTGGPDARRRHGLLEVVGKWGNVHLAPALDGASPCGLTCTPGLAGWRPYSPDGNPADKTRSRCAVCERKAAKAAPVSPAAEGVPA